MEKLHHVESCTGLGLDRRSRIPTDPEELLVDIEGGFVDSRSAAAGVDRNMMQAICVYYPEISVQCMSPHAHAARVMVVTELDA